jgi:hypothetical protein
MKRYHIGKVFKKNSQSSNQRSKAAQEMMEASFDLISSTKNQRGSGDDLIYEAEILKVCDQIASQYAKEIGKYRIKISSSEIIDGMLDEVQVSLDKRHHLLKLLSSIENK